MCLDNTLEKSDKTARERLLSDMDRDDLHPNDTDLQQLPEFGSDQDFVNFGDWLVQDFPPHLPDDNPEGPAPFLDIFNDDELYGSQRHQDLDHNIAFPDGVSQYQSGFDVVNNDLPEENSKDVASEQVLVATEIVGGQTSLHDQQSENIEGVSRFGDVYLSHTPSVRPLAPGVAPIPTEETPAPRRRSCPECRRSHRKCSHRDTIINQPASPTVGFLEMIFLDMKLWKELIDHLNVEVAILSTRHEGSSLWGKMPLVLHIDVEDDALPPAHGSEQTVYFNTLKTLDQPVVDCREFSLREPAITEQHFDLLITKKIWHGKVGNEEGLTREERAVFSIARKFCGYFTILHNLHKSKIGAVYHDDLATKLVALELLYFIVYRLISLFRDLANQLQVLGATIRRRQQKRPYVALYALELIHRCLSHFGVLSWGLPKKHVLHPLYRIRAVLNKRTTHILSRIREFWCGFSSLYGDGRRLVKNPTVQFISSKVFELPGCLSIIHERENQFHTWENMPWRRGMMPMWDAHLTKHSLIDVLSCRENIEVNVFLHPRGRHRRRFSDVDSVFKQESLSILRIGEKSKSPNTHQEAPPTLGTSSLIAASPRDSTRQYDLSTGEVSDELGDLVREASHIHKWPSSWIANASAMETVDIGLSGNITHSSQRATENAALSARSLLSRPIPSLDESTVGEYETASEYGDRFNTEDVDTDSDASLEVRASKRLRMTTRDSAPEEDLVFTSGEPSPE